MQLYAKDFNFNGHNLSDFQLILCSFDSENVSNEQDTGLSLDLITTTVPSSNKNLLSGINYNDVYVFNATMLRDPCGLSDTNKISLSYEEIREIENWLSVSKYTKFTIDDVQY